MGEVADTLTKKKKKGRPSLIEVQKRALKHQQLLLQQEIGEPRKELRSGFKNPNSLYRSSRRRSNLNEAFEESDGDDDDDKRRDKKRRMLHGFNSNDRLHSSTLKYDGCDLDANASIRRRIIGAAGSDYKGQKASKGTDILQRSLVESEPFTPLPDKKLLLFIVDRLQKKDTYGVYSDPVDPEELPDYHDIIKNPMDFSTLRRKLESGAYASLEQFEASLVLERTILLTELSLGCQDVFLICTNAMEYNSADTVYYRQARAMLEIAKKDFENLRQESDEEEPVTLRQQPKVVERGRPTGTCLKKQPEPSSVDRTISEISAEATATQTLGGDNSRSSGAYNLRSAHPSYRFRQSETSVRINHYNENQSGLLIDWEKEFPPSVVKAVDKYGMKNVENRRDTYNHVSTSSQEDSIFATFDDALKQLTPVGLRNEYGYAMSLARYAAKLGPVAWRFVSKRTETALPTGIEFGPGWVGENPETPPPQQQISLSGKQKGWNDLAPDDDRPHSSRIMSPTTSVSSSIVGNIHSSHESKESAAASARLFNQESESKETLTQSRSWKQLSRDNNPNQMLETAFSRQGLLPNRKHEFNRFPPDLNVKLVSPNSPVSNLQAASSQHPDLALQL
ncbi:unnamed protein product [Thlaspi arvense]|uniref:Bromo domain-containing protein n=1 Tax=Thlaspi arvense TaxID=13288 RepID=A0AAU9SJA5_THLAR|nr:unnamed protein product [Thlaspi arvense]